VLRYATAIPTEGVGSSTLSSLPLLRGVLESWFAGAAPLVRAFGAQQRFILTAAAKCDDANRSIFYLWTTNQWLRVQMSLIGAAVTGTVVSTLLWKAHSITAGDAGLILQYATQFIGLVQGFFRSKTMLEVRPLFTPSPHPWYPSVHTPFRSKTILGNLLFTSIVHTLTGLFTPLLR
jgi:hypothetical protein